MKDSVIIFILVVALAGSTLANICLAKQSAKWHYRATTISKTLGEVREQNKNLRKVVDSIDNPHHHGYLLTLQPYRALQK